MKRTPIEPVYARIGQRIKCLRWQRQLPQEALVAPLGFQRVGSVSEIERGNLRIQVHTLFAAADFFDVPVTTLLTDANDKMQDLRIGSLVHYVYHNGNGLYRCVASIVVDVFDQATGNINVREFGGMDLKSCLYSERCEGGTWHFSDESTLCKRGGKYASLP